MEREEGETKEVEAEIKWRRDNKTEKVERDRKEASWSEVQDGEQMKGVKEGK